MSDKCTFDAFIIVILTSLVRKNMDGDSDCDKDEHQAEGPVLCNKDSTIQKGQPYKSHRYDLDMQRNSLMLKKVLDIWSQFRMVHQPLIQTEMTAQKKRCTKQQEWRGRQYRQKDAKYS